MHADSTLIGQRLAALRAKMAEQNLDALLIPRADEYLGEYLPPRNERMLWASGFAGSAGLVVILAEQAAIFVDGRYTQQVRSQAPAAHFRHCHIETEPPLEWLVEQLTAGARIGADPRTHTWRWWQRAERHIETHGCSLVGVTENLVDQCWTDRPEATLRQARLHPLAYTGRSSAEKRQQIGEATAAAAADVALLFATDSLAWLLNIRGEDVPHTPLVLGFGLIGTDGQTTFFSEPAKIPAGFDEHVGAGVRVVDETEAGEVLAELAGQRVLIDPDTCNAWSALTLKAAGATLVEGADPVLLPKACKNATEIAGMRAAHVRDAVAEVRFLAWLDAQLEAGRLPDEGALSDQLLAFRAADPLFRDTSFDTISAAGPNAAMAHYRHDDNNPGPLLNNNVYLFDSGGQYPDGTTDITRTVAIGTPGDEHRRMFTLVLKGHIALDRARFPAGTTGNQLDALARQFLWQHGFDYDHGTGHGVGAYLSVHEGPQRIGKTLATALLPGMVVSNEPGYYRPDGFGIRCENLVLVCEVDTGAGTERPMLGFDALTLVPFDMRLIDWSLMSQEDIDWLNAYHRRVRETIGPLLDGSDHAWLMQATEAVGD